MAPAETRSDGLAIETHVLARLLGLKLLTLEGHVLVSPAAVRAERAERIEPVPSRRSAGALPPARGRNGAGRARAALPDPRADGDPGARLTAAAQLLRECSRELRR